MYFLSGLLNVIAAVLFIYWSFNKINNIMLMIPAFILIMSGSICVDKVTRNK